jgi:hypothetical protein
MRGAFACHSPEVICRRLGLPARSPTTRPAANSNHRYLQLSRIQDPQILIANPVGLAGAKHQVCTPMSTAAWSSHRRIARHCLISQLPMVGNSSRPSHLPRIGDKHASEFLDIKFGYKNTPRLRGYSYAKWPRQIHHDRPKVVRFMEWSIKPGVPKFVG